MDSEIFKPRYINGFQTILQDFTSISAQCHFDVREENFNTETLVEYWRLFFICCYYAVNKKHL